jgi:hypothetical protein
VSHVGPILDGAFKVSGELSVVIIESVKTPSHGTESFVRRSAVYRDHDTPQQRNRLANEVTARNFRDGRRISVMFYDRISPRGREFDAQSDQTVVIGLAIQRPGRRATGVNNER